MGQIAGFEQLLAVILRRCESVVAQLTAAQKCSDLHVYISDQSKPDVSGPNAAMISAKSPVAIITVTSSTAQVLSN